MKSSKDDDVKLEDLELRPGAGRSLHDNIHGKYWHIYLHDTRVGKISIDFIDNKVLGIHPSIDIFINQAFQGRHIGRYAYLLACQKSGLDQVYMHTRKSNLASIKAAADAGFVELKNDAFKQTVMVWRKDVHST